MDRPVNTVLGGWLPGWLLDYGPVAFIALVGVASTHTAGPSPLPWGRVLLSLATVVVALINRHRRPLVTLAVILVVALVTDYRARLGTR